MGGVDGKGGDEEATLDGGATVDGWGGGGGVLGETVISTSHHCAGALHKPPRAVSKCC